MRETYEFQSKFLFPDQKQKKFLWMNSSESSNFELLSFASADELARAATRAFANGERARPGRSQRRPRRWLSRGGHTQV